MLTKTLCPGISAAYVPQGPEFGPDRDQYGLFLEALSEAIRGHLEPAVAFIRYDLPWESQYTTNTDDGSEQQQWSPQPEPRLQELRMNFGTKCWNLRKAVVNLTGADTVILNLASDEEKLLSEMKPKTRYNIRLAQRKGVRVFHASPDLLPDFYEVYRQTSERNHFYLGEYEHFSTLFSALSCHPRSSEILFLLGSHDRDLLAGAIIVISGRTATYLFGASSNEKRNLMAPYAVQWAAMQLARAKGCLRYDLGVVSPTKDPNHPFYGLYRFKTGFGGKVVHRSGTWDYPLDLGDYKTFRNSETIEGILRTR